MLMKKSIFLLVLLWLFPLFMQAAITVRLNATSCPDWTNVYLYTWNVVGSSMQYPDWPGTALAQDADGYWTYTFEEGVTSAMIIFNNASSAAQTQDVSVNASTDYKLGANLQGNIWQLQLESGGSATPYDFISEAYEGAPHFYCRMQDGTVTIVSETGGSFPYYETSFPYYGEVVVPQTVTSTSWQFQNVPVTAIGDYAFAFGGSELPCTQVNYSNTLINNYLGDFTAVDKEGYQNWYSTGYGATMNGYSNGSDNPNQDWLLSPIFDFTNAGTVSINFEHCINYYDGSSEDMPFYFAVLVGIDPTGNGNPDEIQWTQEEYVNYPAGNNNTFTSVTFNLPVEFCKPNVRIAFRYISTANEAARWQIRNFAAVSECSTEVKQGITKVTLPASITSIGEGAFYKCDQLQTLRIYGNTVPTFGTTTFEGCTALTAIQVDCGMKEQFLANGWDAYESLIVEVPPVVNTGSNRSDWGFVQQTVLPDCENPNVSLTAYAYEGYELLHWSDGTTTNPYVKENLTEDFNMYAYFIPASNEPITLRLKKPDVYAIDTVFIFYVYSEGNLSGTYPMVLDETGQWYTCTLREYPADIYLQAILKGMDSEVSEECYSERLPNISVSTDMEIVGIAGNTLDVTLAEAGACAEPVQDLQAVYENNETTLSWIAPADMPEYLSWGSQTVSSALGVTEPFTSMVAQRFDSDALFNYVGRYLTQVAFVPGTEDATYKIQVWWVGDSIMVDGVMMEDRTLVAEQPVDAGQIAANEWAEVTLAQPILLDYDLINQQEKELWIGYSVEVTNAEGAYPMAYDNGGGIHKDYQYSMISLNGGPWASMPQYGFSGNMLIRGKVENIDHPVPAPVPAKTKVVTTKPVRTSYTVANLSMDVSRLRLANAPTTANYPAAMPAMRISEDLGEKYYRIYRNGSLLDSCSTTFYTISECTQEYVTYAVEVVNGPCVSPKSMTYLTVDPMPLAPSIQVQDYSDSFLEESSYKLVLMLDKHYSCGVIRYDIYMNGDFYDSLEPQYTGMYINVYPGWPSEFQVKAIYDFGYGEVESDFSNTVSYVTDCRGKNPVIQRAVADGKQITLDFTLEARDYVIQRDGLPVDTIYYVYFYLQYGESDFWLSYSWVDTTLVEGQTYNYQVGALCQTSEEILWSDPVQVTIEPCAVQTNFAASSNGVYSWNGIVYTESGDYTQVFKMANGCDSVVTANLTIHPAIVLSLKAPVYPWALPSLAYFYEGVESVWGINEPQQPILEKTDGRFNWWAFVLTEPTAIAKQNAGESVQIAFRALDNLTRKIPMPESNTCYLTGNLFDQRTCENGTCWDEGYVYVVDCEEDMETYYASLLGKQESVLSEAVHDMIANPKVVSYYYGLQQAYAITDTDDDGFIIDMYSNCTGTFDNMWGESGGVETCGSFNREHALPKSWWGHNDNNVQSMYTDLMHVIPTNSEVNSARGAYPYSEVANPTTTFGNGSKVGNSTFPGYSNTAFEPADEYKGDVARIYFYMITCYNDVNFSQNTYADGSTNVFSYIGGKPVFTDFAKNLFLKWHRQDPVSDRERHRNDAVQSIQGNRNPFVDIPDLAEYIWGTKQGEMFTFGANDPTGLENAMDDIQIRVEQNRILLQMDGQADVVLYDMLGRLLQVHKDVMGVETIEVPISGVYLLKVNGMAYKVVVP